MGDEEFENGEVKLTVRHFPAGDRYWIQAGVAAIELTHQGWLDLIELARAYYEEMTMPFVLEDSDVGPHADG